MKAKGPNISDLRWLLAGLCLVMAMHLQHFAIWVSLSVIALITWRYLLAYFQRPLPRLYILIPLTILAGIGIMLNYHGLFGRDASVELLALMLSLKLMEARTRRDFLLLIFGGYFLTVASFLFAQSMAYAAIMLLATFVLTGALVGVSHPNGDMNWRHQAKITGALMMQGIPIMVVLFLLFPRVQGPLWGIPEDTNKAISGLSDSMAPGEISELILSGRTAFRVQFEDKIPPSSQLYWRGPVLSRFDGNSWTAAKSVEKLPPEILQVRGSPTRYTMTMEPSNTNYMLLLDMPTELPEKAIASSDLQILAKDAIRQRIRYPASSHLDYTLASDAHPLSLRANLQIPSEGNPKSKALAQSWVDAGKSPEDIVKTALDLFRNGDYYYTLRPPRLSQQKIDDFLFNTKRGFCEHYSSAFVYLMRAADIPARVVTGYQGGELNPVGNYLIVRQADAHAWAEVWLNGQGWVRVDPTGAVSPSRIEYGIETAIPDENPLPLFIRNNNPRIKRIYLNLDAIDHAWNQWVLDYNQDRQMELLSRLAGSRLTWQDLVALMMVTVGAVVLLLGYITLSRHSRNRDELQQLYDIFLKKLQSKGVSHLPHEGPKDLSLRAMNALPQHADRIRAIIDLYVEMRYRDSKNTESLERMKWLIKTFK
jgi:transglutaminase-like putative cysteine protease